MAMVFPGMIGTFLYSNRSRATIEELGSILIGTGLYPNISRAMIQELGASDPGRWLAFCMEAMQHGSLADADDYADAGDDEGEGDKKKVRCDAG
jgi:hypothetical protein